MLLELHLLQNFAPSNLNRDDTGAPKDAEFGGVRRARISSQCLKRAMREEMRRAGIAESDSLAVRTKQLRRELQERFMAAGKAEDAATAVADIVIAALGLKTEKNGKTQYLLFLGQREIDGVVTAALDAWDEVTAPQKNVHEKAQKQLVRALEGKLDGGRAADLALFGRMLADMPERRVDAAAQVAHALSTHRAAMEFDYFTAVDDLQRDDQTGADMIGTVEFTSACFYRYANVNLRQLSANLQDDKALAKTALQAFLYAAVRAVPTGKQNSMGAQNPPSVLVAVLRDRGSWSLANAFLKPVRVEAESDLVSSSALRLFDYWSGLTTMYGNGELKGAWACALDRQSLADAAAKAGVEMVASVDEVWTSVASHLE